MRRRTAFAILLVLFMLVQLFIAVGLAINPTESIPISERAAYFLLMFTYNSSMGLCSEVYGKTGNSLGANGDVFWICSDNLLAYYALQKYNQTISDKIKSKLIEYAQNYSLPTNDEGLPISYKHEAIIGEVLPDEFKTANQFTLKESQSYTVLTEIDNGTVINDWTNYADLVALRGLSAINEGKMAEAKALYDSLMNMWDGYGFYDKAAKENGYYDTYKIGLAIILRKRLGLEKPIEEFRMEEILLACQDPATGGIATGYNKELSTKGHNRNTETAAIIAIADVNYTPHMEKTGSILENLTILTVLVSAIAAVSFVVAKTILNKK